MHRTSSITQYPYSAPQRTQTRIHSIVFVLCARVFSTQSSVAHKGHNDTQYQRHFRLLTHTWVTFQRYCSGSATLIRFSRHSLIAVLNTQGCFFCTCLCALWRNLTLLALLFLKASYSWRVNRLWHCPFAAIYTDRASIRRADRGAFDIHTPTVTTKPTVLHRRRRNTNDIQMFQRVPLHTWPIGDIEIDFTFGRLSRLISNRRCDEMIDKGYSLGRGPS